MAISGIGTTFSREDPAASDTYIKLAKVYGISGPSMSRNTIETTTYDADSGYMKKIGGLRDPGQLTFSLNFAYAEYLILKGDFEADQAAKYQVVLPDEDTTTLTLTGLVTEIPIDVPLDDRVTVDVTIEISGKIVDDTPTGS